MSDDSATWLQDRRHKDAIHTLALDYQRGCDGGWDGPSHADPDRLTALFTPGGSYKIPQLREAARGHREIRAIFVELQRQLPRVIHYLVDDQIVVDGDAATGRFKGVAAIWSDGRRQLAFGVYRGRFLNTDAGWRFDHWQFDLVSPPRG